MSGNEVEVGPVPPVAVGADDGPRLHKGALGLVEVTAQSVGLVAPEASIGLGSVVIAAAAGGATALSFLIATVGIAFLAFIIAGYSRIYSSAGSFYTYIARTLRPELGVLTGWFYVIGLGPMAMAGGPIASGLFWEPLMKSVFGIEIKWTVYAAIVTVAVFVMAYLRVSVSTRALLGMSAFGISAILVMGVIILAKGGAHGISLSPFSPHSSPTHWSGILKGLEFSVLSLIGFETAATLAEETRDPKRNISRALLLTVVIVGAFYIFMSWTMAIGFGVHQSAATWGTDSVPIQTLATKYGATWLGNIALFIIAFSWFANALACANTSSRILYGMAREGMLPRALALIHPKRQTPVAALVAVVSVGVLITLVLGLAVKLSGLAIFTVTYGVIAIVIMLAYIMLAFGGLILPRRLPGASFWGFAIASLGAMVMIGFGLYGSFFPFPPWPYSLGPILAIATVVIGCVFVGVLRVRQPRVVARAGSITE